MRVGVADVLDASAHDCGHVDVARLVVISPATTHDAGLDQRLAGDARPWVLREDGVEEASEIWSQTLSGWPSVTDSEVNR